MTHNDEIGTSGPDPMCRDTRNPDEAFTMMSTLVTHLERQALLRPAPRLQDRLGADLRGRGGLQAGESRALRVQTLREAVARGEYVVDPAAVAAAILARLSAGSALNGA
jgi:hypothetical protein